MILVVANMLTGQTQGPLKDPGATVARPRKTADGKTADGKPAGGSVASIPAKTAEIAPGESATVETSGTVSNPKLWNPNSPNRYVAVTTVTKKAIPTTARAAFRSVWSEDRKLWPLLYIQRAKLSVNRCC